MRRNGFTMVELLVAVAVTSLIGSVIAAVLAAGFDSWIYSNNKLILQKTTNDLINYLIDGGFDSEGIRDLVDLKNATGSSISFTNLWHDDTHKADPLMNREQEFTLNRQFKAGSSVPMGQVKRAGTDEYVTVPIEFIYGEGTDPDKPDDVIKFLDPLPVSARVKAVFTPDGDADPSTQRHFAWDSKTKRVFETYNGKTEDIIKRDDKTKIYALSFMYYDNLNQPVNTSGGEFSVNDLRKITGVKIYIFAARKSDWLETTTYTNIRNVSSIGVSIVAGSEVPIPTTDKIKAFSIGNFYGGAGKDNVITLLATPKKGKAWRIMLKISKESENKMQVDYFQMEYPPGTKVASMYVELPFYADEFVNLMTLDRTGKYDYDEDTSIYDIVHVISAPVILKVERCDFDGAQLFVRP